MRLIIRMAGVLVATWINATTIAMAGADELPLFKADAQPREYATGGHVGVFGGGNLFQSGDLDVSTPLLSGQKVTLKTKDQPGGVAGIRAGYTWPGWGQGSGFGDTIPVPVDGGFAMLPTLDAEFFWTGFKYKARQTFVGIDTELTSDVNAYIVSLDPILKFQIGMFRPYVGMGIGAAYIDADKARVSGAGLGSTNLLGSADDWVLAAQGLAGVEVFIAKNWALTLDYKYLNFIDPHFKSSEGNIPLEYKSDVISQHIITAGVNFYF
jgi:opacity protein-like surface antigen